MNFFKVDSKWIKHLTLRSETETARRKQKEDASGHWNRGYVFIRILNAQKEKAEMPKLLQHSRESRQSEDAAYGTEGMTRNAKKTSDWDTSQNL